MPRSINNWRVPWSPPTTEITYQCLITGTRRRSLGHCSQPCRAHLAQRANTIELMIKNSIKQRRLQLTEEIFVIPKRLRLALTECAIRSRCKESSECLGALANTFRALSRKTLMMVRAPVGRQGPELIPSTAEEVILSTPLSFNNLQCIWARTTRARTASSRLTSSISRSGRSKPSRWCPLRIPRHSPAPRSKAVCSTWGLVEIERPHR